MADNIEKKVLISVEILDNFVKAKKNVDEWRAKMKEAQDSGNKTAEEMRGIALELANANNQFRQAKKEIESAAKSQEIFAAAGEQTNRTLGDMQRELSALKNTPFTGMDPKQVDNVKQRMADLMAEIQDYKLELKGLDAGEWAKNTAEGIEFITASASALSNGMKTLGVDSEVLGGLESKTIELIAVVQAMGVVTEYLEKKKYKLIIANMQNIASMAKEAIASKITAAANWVMAGSIDGASLALKLFRGALIATGIGAFIVLLGLLISNWDKLTGFFKAGTDGLSGFGKAFNKVKEIAMGVFEVIKNYVLGPFKAIGKLIQGDFSGAVNEVKNMYNVVGNFQKGMAEQSARNDAEILAARRKAYSKYLLLEAGKLEKSLEVDKARGISADKLYKKEMQIINDKVRAYSIALKTIKDKNSEEYKDTLKNLEDAKQVKEVAQATEQKRIQDEAKESRKKQQDNYLKSLDLDYAYQSEKLKAEKGGYTSTLDQKLSYEKEAFELEQNYQKKKLDAQKAFKTITVSEYENQYKILDSKQKSFTEKQIKEINEYYSQQRESILGLIKDNVDNQITQIKEKYEKVLNSIGEMKEPVKLAGQSDEDYQKELTKFKTFMLNKAAYEKQLEEQKEQEIKDINQKYILAKASLSSDKIDEQHANELLKYQDNERKKLEITLKSEQEKLEALKKLEVPKNADGTINEDAQKEKEKLILESENRIAGTRLSLDTLTNNTALINARKNADETYRIKKDALEKEIKLAEGNVDKQAQLTAQLEQLDADYTLKKIENVESWANKAIDILTSLTTLTKAQADSEVQDAEDTTQKRKDILDNQLAQGIISQKKHDDEIAKSEKALEAKKTQIARRQAEREKAVATLGVIVNTAAAVAKGFSQLGPILGAIMTGVTIAMGAIQIAAINAAPLPKASRGALLTGPSHAGGGILIEAEGDEAIINKKSTRAFKPLLSAINEWGGGVQFAANGGIPSVLGGITNYQFTTDGGYTVRAQERNLTANEIEQAMARAVAQIKVYSTVEDYRRADKNYTEIENSGRF